MWSGIIATLQPLYLVGSVVVQSYICQPPTVPVLNPLNDTSVTVNTPFTVSGSGEAESQIVIDANGTDIIELHADPITGTYSGEVTLTTIDEFALTVRSVRTCGAITGNTIMVTTVTGEPTQPEENPTPPTPTPPITTDPPAQPTPPINESPVTSDEQQTSSGLKLYVYEPARTVVSTSDGAVYIRGGTSEPSKVIITVNGTVRGNTYVPLSTFGMSIPLDYGDNTILIKATSSDGSATVRLTITRVPPPVEEKPWYQTEPGRQAIIVGVSAISIIILIAIIIFILP